MSFGPRMRAARGPPSKEEAREAGLLGVLGLDQHMAFLQGCVSGQPKEIANLVVDFPDRPAKMLGASIADYGPTSLLKVQLCDLPRLPLGKLKSTEVVVEVHSVSVNPTDWKQRKGTLSTICPLTLPCILGIDLSGRVVRAGDDSPYSEGDEVFGRQTLDRMRELNGSYAEYAIVDSADLYRKPSRLTHDEAAAVPHACLAAYAALAHVGQLVSKCKASQERAVLILGGSGGVGTFAVQVAKRHFSCFVMASCSAANVDLVRELGADEVLDYSDPGFLRSVGGTKFDVVLDCVGGDDYWTAFRPALKADGVYVTLVGSERHLAQDKEIDMSSVLQIRADYLMRQISSKLGAAHNYHILTGSQLQSSDLRIIASLLEQDALRVVLDSTFSLYDIAKAHERSETHHAVGKIVVQVRKGRDGGRADAAQQQPSGNARANGATRAAQRDKIDNLEQVMQGVLGGTGGPRDGAAPASRGRSVKFDGVEPSPEPPRGTHERGRHRQSDASSDEIVVHGGHQLVPHLRPQ